MAKKIIILFLFFINISFFDFKVSASELFNSNELDYSSLYAFTWWIDNEQKNWCIDDESATWCVEQKNDTISEEKKELVKNINNIIIESYKVKFFKILNNLFDKIDNKTKEDKIKILWNILVSVESKLDLINSWKVNISKNRKEVLVSVFSFLKEQIQLKIKDIIEKNKI